MTPDITIERHEIDNCWHIFGETEDGRDFIWSCHGLDSPWIYEEHAVHSFAAEATIDGLRVEWDGKVYEVEPDERDFVKQQKLERK